MSTTIREAISHPRRLLVMVGVALLVAMVGVMNASAAPGDEPSNFMEGGSIGGDGNVRDTGLPDPPYDWANTGTGAANTCPSAEPGFTVINLAGTGGLFNCGQGDGQFTTPLAPIPTANGTVGTNNIDAIAFDVDALSSDQDTCGVPQTLDGDPTVYTGAGGEKNGDSLVVDSTGANAVETWGTASVPPKDDITNVYAVSRSGFTKVPATPGAGPEREIFFGAERVVNNGDTHIDFEFLQADVGLNPAAPPDACEGLFDGNRTQGDFIVAIDYAIGGSLGIFELWQWNCNEDTHSAENAPGFITDPVANPTSLNGTPCDFAAGTGASAGSGVQFGTGPHYQQVACVDFNGFGTNPDCTSATAGDPNTVCDKTALPVGQTECAPGVPVDAIKAVTNGSGPVPCGGWACRLSDGTTPTGPIGTCTENSCIDTNELMEGAVNLKAIGFQGCLSTLIPHTRSSGSFTATLKDFSIIQFKTCAIEVDKTGDTVSKVGDAVDYTITVTNPGSTALFVDDITDTLLGNIIVNGVTQANPLITSNTCDDAGKNPLQPGDTCVITATRTVQAGDPDPLPNTVTVVYNSESDFSGTALSDSDPHSVNLFQPCVGADKTGDTLSKIGDFVEYTITFTNCSSDDTPPLDCQGTDPIILPGQPIFDDILPLGDTVIQFTRPVQPGDPDPLVNTSSITCNVAGFPNVLTDSDSHAVNLFQPSIDIVKTGDELSKVTDSVNYTITLYNTSSADTPTLHCTITDPLLGINKNVDLDPGENNVTNQSRTVLGSDPDPLVNTASASCSPDGFPNVLTDSDDHSVNLFQPSIDIVKTGDELSKVTDSMNYTITLYNTSSADTPTLHCTITDPLLGIDKDVDLDPGENDVTNQSRTVLGSDPDPLVNTASASCSPDGFPNVLTDSDDHTVNLFQPSIDIVKTGDATSKVGDSVNYTITLYNTSSADTPTLHCTITDPLLGINKDVDLDPGENNVTNQARTVLGGDPDPLVNTASVTCRVDGFTNVLNDSDDHTVNLFQPSIDIVKTGDELSKEGDSVNYTITLTNTSSTDTPTLSCTITDPMFPGIPGPIILNPGQNHVINESRTVLVGDPDPLVNTASVTCRVDGFTNVLNDSDDHTVNLFQPSIDIVKTGDELSKVGDSVNYTITLYNTSSADTPTLHCTITDPLLGINKNVDLDPGENDVTNQARTVLGGDPDPLVNTASVTCRVDGFTNVLNDSDDHSVNLFQPGVDVTKACDDFAKAPQTPEDAAGLNPSDDIHCVITVTNTGSADSPNLVNGTISDTLCGNLLGTLNPVCAPVSSDCTSTLATGSSCTIVYDYCVVAHVAPPPCQAATVTDTPDPIVNTVQVLYNPQGFPNAISDNASESIDVLHPNYTVTKDCLTDVVPPGGSAIFEAVFTNTGDTNLTVTADENMTTVPGAIPVTAGTPFTLNVGQTRTFEISIIAGQGPIVENTLNASATLPANTGLTNVLNRSASDFCPVRGGATRTPGFWQTHQDYTCHVFEDHLGGSIDLGWRTLDSCVEVFGMFWASNAFESDGTRRDKLCQARVIGSFQLLAAILNTGLDNGAAVPIDPVTGLDIITAMQNALAGTDIQEIKRIQGLLDAYNNSGDDIAIIDNDGVTQGRANPRGAKGIADLTIADC